jgi:zinc D-Ala-D-Ala carboxypeptidase
MNLSPHFTLEEMTFSQTASRYGIDNTPTPDALACLHDLAAALEEVRALFGNRAVIISSGYRCEALNEAVGGSSTSAHMLGMAADIVSPPPSPLDLCRLIEGSDIAFDQLIFEFDWVHFAIGPQNRRQVLTYNGNGYTEGLPA